MATSVGNWLLPQEMAFYALCGTTASGVDIHHACSFQGRYSWSPRLKWIRLRTHFLSLGQICLGRTPYFYIPYKKFKAGQKKIMGKANCWSAKPRFSFFLSNKVRPDMLNSFCYVPTIALICTATLHSIITSWLCRSSSILCSYLWPCPHCALESRWMVLKSQASPESC